MKALWLSLGLSLVSTVICLLLAYPLAMILRNLIFKGVHYEMEVTTPDGFEWLVHSTDMCPVGKQVGIKVDPFDIQIMNKPASEDEEAVGVNE